MHMSANLLPLKQHICPALSPAESSRASLLPLSFEMLCAAACLITTSISCSAASKHQLRAKAPPTRGSFRLPEPQLPSLPEVVKESRIENSSGLFAQSGGEYLPQRWQTRAVCRTRAAMGPLCRPPPTQLASLLPWPPMNSNERSAPAAGGLGSHCAATLAGEGL